MYLYPYNIMRQALLMLSLLKDDVELRDQMDTTLGRKWGVEDSGEEVGFVRI